MADNQMELLEKAKLIQRAKAIQQQKKAQETSDSRMGEAALQGFGQGATLGYLPEMQAGLEQGLSKVLPEDMGGGDDLTYAQRLQQMKERGQSLEQKHPVASGIGNVAGSLTTLPFGGAAAKGASGLAKIAKGAGVGAAYGAAINPNQSGQDANFNLMQRLENAGYGAALGGSGEALLAGGSAALKNLSEKLKSSSVMKQIGANASQIRKILQKDEIPKIEGFLKDENLMTLGKTVEDVAERAQSVMDETGPAIGKLYEDAQMASQTIGVGQKNRISGPELADEIIKDTKEKYKAHANRDMVIKEIEQSVAPLRDMGDNPNIVDIHNYRKSLDENINWSQKAQERDAVQKAFIDARNKVADKTKQVIESVDQSLGSEQTSLLKNLNARYSSAATVSNIATQGSAREMSRALMGAGVIGGGAGIITTGADIARGGDVAGAIGKGLAVGAGAALARKYGTPIAYKAGKAAGAIGKAASSASNRPGAVAAGIVSPWVQMREKDKNK